MSKNSVNQICCLRIAGLEGGERMMWVAYVCSLPANVVNSKSEYSSSSTGAENRPASPFYHLFVSRVVLCTDGCH